MSPVDTYTLVNELNGLLLMSNHIVTRVRVWVCAPRLQTIVTGKKVIIYYKLSRPLLLVPKKKKYNNIEQCYKNQKIGNSFLYRF